jgi:hypothetical protein
VTRRCETILPCCTYLIIRNCAIVSSSMINRRTPRRAEAERSVQPPSYWQRSHSSVPRPRSWSTAGPLPFASWLAGVICGISSVLLGSIGVLYGSAKREWLLRRLMTERLRQFHFQTFVSLLPQIISSLHDGHAKTQFASIRRQKFDAFRARMVNNLEAELAEVLGAQEPEPWADRPPPSPPIAHDDPALKELFEAYRELRIEHQRRYANFKIREVRKF